MFGVTDYAAFVVAFIILLAIPGPGNLALILSTGKGGIRGGLASTFGIIFGDQVLLWLAVAGVAALLKAYPAAFHMVQWLGAAYLVYLGLRMILAKPGAAPTLEIKAAVKGLMDSLTRSGAKVYVPRRDEDYAVTAGLRMLTLRRLVRLGEDGLHRVAPEELPLLRYYANAIAETVARAEHPPTILTERVSQRLGQFALAQEETPLAGT